MRVRRHQRKSSRVTPAKIRYESDYQLNWASLIEPLRAGKHTIADASTLSIPGDAPKSFVRIREYDKNDNRPTHSVARWPGYIAKVGSKWYPIESITEHLLTRVGEALGAKVAESQLRMVGSQVRFLSKYFLKHGETLAHGIEIFRSHLDEEMVEEIASTRQEQVFYTFQTVCAAIDERFPDHFASIMHDFVEMLAFDAIVGHNDRHPANWGVIVPVRSRLPPRFSPIYDTARALLWNNSEKTLLRMITDESSFNGYIRKSRPQVGWDGCQQIDHFELVSSVYTEYPDFRATLEKFGDPRLIAKCQEIVQDEFRELVSDQRRHLICKLLCRRHELYRAAACDT